MEVVVVDDGSTDDTAAVATSLGPDIRVLGQPNRGPAAARNAGVLATHAEYIAFLDADDIWPAGRLAVLHSRLESDPGVLLAVGRTQLVTANPAAGGRTVYSGAPWHAPVFGSTLIRRAAFGIVGPIDADLQPAEDMDWFIRAREHEIPTMVVDETTLLYRLHGASLTSGADPIRRNMLLALKRSLDRRRRTGSSARMTSWLPTSDDAP